MVFQTQLLQSNESILPIKVEHGNAHHKPSFQEAGKKEKNKKRILSLRPAWAKLSKLYLENKIEKQKGAGGMAQEPLVSILIIAKKKKNFWN
jgi:hypothetical protein